MFKDPEKRREYVKEWKRNNPEKMKAQRKRYEKKNGLKHKRRSRGWTPALVEQAMLEQNGCCAICMEPFTKKPHADHKHTTPPKPRGLLCNLCNTGIGFLKENPATLLAAVEYLKKHETCQIGTIVTSWNYIDTHR